MQLSFVRITRPIRPIRAWQFFVIALLAMNLVACQQPTDSEPETAGWLSGGGQTVVDNGTGAYGHPFPGLSAYGARLHRVGDINFEAQFVAAPNPVRQGLGPIYNSNACQNCHVADGGGVAPDIDLQRSSLLLRISLPGKAADGSPKPVPGFGGQLQTKSIFGAKPEADVSITYNDSDITLPGARVIAMHQPIYHITNPYIPLPAGTLVSPRVALPVIGLGLLEAIPEQTLEAFAAEQRARGDGVHGMLNHVWDVLAQHVAVGRFGWKAGVPSVLQQAAAAYNEDMGVTNKLFPTESSIGQQQYQAKYLTGTTDVSDSLLDAVAFYARSLAVPARRNIQDPQVQRGEVIFNQVGCASCHIPTIRTGVDVAFPAVSNQVIHPYTDLLLHDMGPGLADNRGEFEADGTQWRTPALWGIGLRPIVNAPARYLHDGRARSVLEAILWHGGEALHSRQMVQALPPEDVDALLAFIKSL